MKIPVSIFPIVFSGAFSKAATVQCIGSGLVAEIEEDVRVAGQDLGPDFTATQFSSDTGDFSLYVGFHPWVEKGPDRVKRMDLVSRYEYPMLVIHSGDEESDFLELVLIMKREEFGKTCFLHLMAPNRGFMGRGDLTDFLLSVRYSPSDCLEEQTAEPDAALNRSPSAHFE